MNPTPPVPRPGAESRSVFPDLDAAYRRQLETLARVRRAVSVVATSRKRLELRLAELERETDRPDGRADSEIGAVRRQLDEDRAEELRVTAASQRLQDKISAMHSAQVAVEAAYAAAEATAAATIAEVMGHV